MDDLAKQASIGVGACASIIVLLFFVIFYGMAILFPPPAGADTTDSGTVACGAIRGVDSLVPGFAMVPKEEKLGHEQHLGCTYPTHFNGKDTLLAAVGMTGCGAHSPHTTDQEHWYYTTEFGYIDWAANPAGQGPFIHTKAAEEARKLVPHAKLIITSVETHKSVVVSAEEEGPNYGEFLRDGVNAGAPPEVYRALGTSDPYTKNPKDNKGRITVQFVAADQQKTAKLGPCQ